ncbi:MAG TPA: T9SS type A sorting domain-containing protein, partial [Candidatus Kapabacteria bacterium]|nr:T9SS type A sorting domain-containing protein [Candidatus Kapabacteria bacterium]
VTYDHGQTWKRSIIDANSTIFSMTFLNSKIGMFSLEGGNLYRTSDGGNNWTLIHVGPYSYRLWSVCFNHSGTVGVLCGDSGFVAYSLDSGQTWTPESVPLFGAISHDNHDLTKVYALSDTTFLIQGSYSLYRKAFHLSGPPASINPALAQYVFLQTYPNPASGQTHFLISGLNHNPNAQLQVEMYDIMGREVRDFSAVANLQRGGEVTEFYADFSSLSSGVYTVRYTFGSYSYGQPVIITH